MNVTVILVDRPADILPEGVYTIWKKSLILSSNSSSLKDEKENDPTRKIASGTEDGEVVILWVARIVREKGLGSFVKTVTELQRLQKTGQLNDLPKFKVVVAGDGPDLPWTRRQLDLYRNVKVRPCAFPKSARLFYL